MLRWDTFYFDFERVASLYICALRQRETIDLISRQISLDQCVV